MDWESQEDLTVVHSLSGSSETIVATLVQESLQERHIRPEHLDGQRGPAEPFTGTLLPRRKIRQEGDGKGGNGCHASITSVSA